MKLFHLLVMNLQGLAHAQRHCENPLPVDLSNLKAALGFAVSHCLNARKFHFSFLSTLCFFEAYLFFYLCSSENFLKSILDFEHEGGGSGSPKFPLSDVSIARPQSAVCSAPICSSHKIDVPLDKILVQWSDEDEDGSSSAAAYDEEKLFWRSVGPRLVKAAFLHYRDDFDIFGYDIGRYFSRLGLNSS